MGSKSRYICYTFSETLGGVRLKGVTDSWFNLLQSVTICYNSLHFKKFIVGWYNVSAALMTVLIAPIHLVYRLG